MTTVAHSERIPQGIFGIERETLRIAADGRLAQTTHPFQHPNLERDFCENQLEIITPPCRSIDEAMQSLAALDGTAREILRKQGETLWKYSNPPYIDSEEEIPVAYFREESRSGKNSYRRYLEQKYGKRLMLLSGIHFNLSFSEEWLEAQRQRTAPEETFARFRDAFYLRLSKHAMQWSWLLVLLTAASPAEHRGADTFVSGAYASRRNSKEGYWNEFVPALDYSDIEAYVQSVERYVQKGVLYSAAELYLPVRLKPKGINRIEALREGVSHIELRMFDLNPLQPLGIAEKDLEFAYLLMVYLSQQEDFAFTPALQAQAIADHQAAASFGLAHVTIGGKPVLTAAAELLDNMAAYLGSEATDIIRYEQNKLKNRLCGQIAALSGEQLHKLVI